MHTKYKINISVHYYILCCITNLLHMNKIPDNLLSALIIYAPARPWFYLRDWSIITGSYKTGGRACEVLPLRKGGEAQKV